MIRRSNRLPAEPTEMKVSVKVSWSVLISTCNTKRFKRTLIYFETDTQYANFRGNPLHQATKRHLNNRSKTMKDERKRLILFGFSFYSLFGVWKTVGMSPC